MYRNRADKTMVEIQASQLLKSCLRVEQMFNLLTTVEMINILKMLVIFHYFWQFRDKVCIRVYRLEPRADSSAARVLSHVFLGCATTMVEHVSFKKFMKIPL